MLGAKACLGGHMFYMITYGSFKGGCVIMKEVYNKTYYEQRVACMHFKFNEVFKKRRKIQIFWSHLLTFIFKYFNMCLFVYGHS